MQGSRNVFPMEVMALVGLPRNELIRVWVDEEVWTNVKSEDVKVVSSPVQSYQHVLEYDITFGPTEVKNFCGIVALWTEPGGILCVGRALGGRSLISICSSKERFAVPFSWKHETREGWLF